MRRPGIPALVVAVLAPGFAAPPARSEWTGPCLSDTAAPICHFWRRRLKRADDGDTIDGLMPTSTGKRKTVRGPNIAQQALGHIRYTSNPRRRRAGGHVQQGNA